MPTKKATQTSAKRAPAAGIATKGFSEEEQAAMKTRAKELKAEERASKNRSEGERDVLVAIEAMSEPDRGMARRIHAIIEATAPNLWSKTWYGLTTLRSDR